MSERKITRQDFYLLKACMTTHLRKMRGWGNSKSWFKFIDIDTCMESLYDADHAYIVDDAFLVVFDLSTPWYAKDEVFMQERIVLRLLPGQGDFSAVPAFLERKAVEAGVVLVGVGTALTRTDAALASIYSSYGFRRETIILVKEPVPSTVTSN